MLRGKAGKHRLIDRVGAGGHAVDLDGDAGTVGHIEAGKLGDRSLLDKLVWPQHALQHNLRLGRHFKIDRIACQQPHWFAQEPPAIASSSSPRSTYICEAKQHRGVVADGDGDFKRTAQRLRLFRQPVEVMIARDSGHQSRAALKPQPRDRDVASSWSAGPWRRSLRR